MTNGDVQRIAEAVRKEFEANPEAIADAVVEKLKPRFDRIEQRLDEVEQEVKVVGQDVSRIREQLRGVIDEGFPPVGAGALRWDREEV